MSMDLKRRRREEGHDDDEYRGFLTQPVWNLFLDQCWNPLVERVDAIDRKVTRWLGALTVLMGTLLVTVIVALIQGRVR